MPPGNTDLKAWHLKLQQEITEQCTADIPGHESHPPLPQNASNVRLSFYLCPSGCWANISSYWHVTSPFSFPATLAAVLRHDSNHVPSRPFCGHFQWPPAWEFHVPIYLSQAWLFFLTPVLTCDKVHSFQCDIHTIDWPRQGTFQLSDYWPVKYFPVSNLEFRREALGRAQLSGIIHSRANKRWFYFI